LNIAWAIGKNSVWAKEIEKEREKNNSIKRTAENSQKNVFSKMFTK
jgi:hypothetical protein